jgi:poly(beta-D-mannuronate) lyase
VLAIRLEGPKLFIDLNGSDGPVLDPAYALGTVFTVELEASGGTIRVRYNGALRLELSKSVSGCYFKAGCYTQSNTSKGDAASAYGEVRIYALSVSHS